jgi:hypothetical protein
LNRTHSEHNPIRPRPGQLSSRNPGNAFKLSVPSFRLTGRGLELSSMAVLIPPSPLSSRNTRNTSVKWARN